MLNIRGFALTVFCLLFAQAIMAQDQQDFVQFKIAPQGQSAKHIGDRSWIASFGKEAKFVISLKLEQSSSRSDFSFSKGSFTHVEGSDPTKLLLSLKKALGAEHAPRPTAKRDKIEFDAVITGTHETRIEGGGFTNIPAGNWIVTKIFLAGGKGEVYLNLDPVSGIGEFSLKDEEYGDIVLNELASVL